MTRDVIDINDYIVLVETGSSKEKIIDSCVFDDSVIAIAFYGSGNVDLTVKYGEKKKAFSYTKGLALSFYANEKVHFEHTISDSKPLECIVVSTSISSLDNHPNQEGDLFGEMLNKLVNPKDHYEEGPSFFMTPEMQSIVNQIFENKYHGKTKMMFFRSQITTLLAHFFGQLSTTTEIVIPQDEKDKLLLAKEILAKNIENPPSLSELSKEIGLNSFKLKKNFKNLFGVPVFKYLQNERMDTAHKLIKNKKMTVQEAAWHVGYDSLGSFSNTFFKKFGYRPSQIKE